MKKLILLIGICCLNAAEIRVDLTQAGKKVSPSLFGLFLEEINHAGDGGLIIRFAMQGGGGIEDVPAHLLESSFAGAIAPQVAGTIEAGRWYDVKIPVEGGRVRCDLDDQEIHNAQVPESLGPSVHGMAGRTAAGEIVVRLVNASPLKQSVSIDLAGASANRYSAIAAQLSSKSLDDENSLTEPARIAPAERQLPGVGNKFQYELEGNSFTVLKLRAEHLP